MPRRAGARWRTNNAGTCFRRRRDGEHAGARNQRNARHHPPQPAEAFEPPPARRPRCAADTVRPDRSRPGDPGIGSHRHRPRLQRRIRSRLDRRTRRRRRGADRRIGVRDCRQPARRPRDTDDLPDQRRRLWRLDRSGAGLRFPYRRRHLRDVHAGGPAWAALLQQRHQTLCVAARRRQRQETVPHRTKRSAPRRCCGSAI